MIANNDSFTYIPVFNTGQNNATTPNNISNNTNEPINRSNYKNAGRTAKSQEKDAKETSQTLQIGFLSKEGSLNESTNGLNLLFSENGAKLNDFNQSLGETNNFSLGNGNSFTNATEFQFAQDVQLPKFDPSAVNEATTASALETGQALEASNNNAKTNIGDAVSTGAEALKKAGVGNDKMQQMLGLVAQIPRLVASATALFSGVFSIPAALAVVAQIVNLLSQAKSLMSSARQDVNDAKEKGKISDEEAKQAHEELDKIEGQFDSLKTLQQTIQAEIDKQQNAVAQIQPEQSQGQSQPPSFQLSQDSKQTLEPMSLEQIDASLALMNNNKASFSSTTTSLGTALDANFGNIQQTAEDTLFNPYISYLEQQKQALENEKNQNAATNSGVTNGSLPSSLLFSNSNTAFTGQNPNGQNPQDNQPVIQTRNPFATPSSTGTNFANTPWSFNNATTISPSMMSFNSPLNMTA